MNLPSDVGDWTHHKPSSFPIQRPCPWPHHVLHKCCRPSEENVKLLAKVRNVNANLQGGKRNEKKKKKLDPLDVQSRKGTDMAKQSKTERLHSDTSITSVLGLFSIIDGDPFH